MNAVSAVLTDDGFSQQPPSSPSASTTAKQLLQWLSQPQHRSEVARFTQSLGASLEACFQGEGPLVNVQREMMWREYHKLRTSVEYKESWTSFLSQSVGVKACPIFYQYVMDIVFKMIKKRYCIMPVQSGVEESSLTYEEINALRYAAGYAPRAVGKKLRKSTQPIRAELTLCIMDLVDDTDDVEDQSQDWIKANDRGGLTHVNDMAYVGGLTHVNDTAYQVFLTMELIVRRQLRGGQFIDRPKLQKEACEDDDVLFYWSMVSGDWDKEESQALLQLIVDLWITIRGFSNASTWMEQYKAANYKSVQKFKGVRKKLLT